MLLDPTTKGLSPIILMVGKYFLLKIFSKYFKNLKSITFVLVIQLLGIFPYRNLTVLLSQLKYLNQSTLPSE